MAKFYGVLGFADSVETSPGVWTEKIVEKSYKGDIIRDIRRWVSTDKVNDDININNSISVIADCYAFQHIFAIRYVKWMGVAWKVESAEVQSPRLILSIGGVYNEE